MTTRALVFMAMMACGGGSGGPAKTPVGSTKSGAGAARSATPAVATAGKPSSNGLDKFMRTRMNKSYTQLVFYVLDSAADVDFAKIETETQDLLSAVATVRGLKPPPVAQSPEALDVYKTYNDVLQRDADRFFESVKSRDRTQMEAALSKVGKACSDCHRFFRIEVKDEKK